jgi:phosphoglycolate phosphatase
MKGILFDKDGTLVDFYATWPPLLHDLARRLAGGDESRAAAMLRIGGLDPDTGHVAAGSVLAAGNTRDLVRLWFPGAGESEAAKRIRAIDEAFCRAGARYSVAVTGLHETLATLAERGLAMGVATSDSTRAARAALAALGVAHHLPHVLGYDAVSSPKPAPDMVEAFCAAAGVRAAETVVVGDNLHDLEMARRAGAGAAVGVLTGNGSYEDLAGHADAVLTSIAELPDWLEAEASQGAAAPDPHGTPQEGPRPGG